MNEPESILGAFVVEKKKRSFRFWQGAPFMVTAKLAYFTFSLPPARMILISSSER